MMIAGNSGSGKSSSIRNLNPEETFIVNCGKKPLPIRGFTKYYTVFSKENPNGNLVNTDNFDEIPKIIEYVGTKRPEIKNLIIDDFQFSMAATIFRKISEKGYDKFNVLAKGIWDTVQFAKNQRDDLNVVFIEHLETNYNDSGVKETKAKTLGKAIDNMVTLDGLFTVILYAEIVKTDSGYNYLFKTRSSGSDTCKTPMEMFEEDYIENDLALVIQKVREYYEG